MIAFASPDIFVTRKFRKVMTGTERLTMSAECHHANNKDSV